MERKTRPTLVPVLVVLIGSLVSSGAPLRDVTDLASFDLFQPTIRCHQNNDHLIRRRQIAPETAAHDVTDADESTERNCYFRKEITLRCHVTSQLGSNVQSIEWRRLGDMTSSTTTPERNWSTVGNKDHLIVDDEAQGYFQCIVKSSLGVAMSDVIHVRKAVLKTKKAESEPTLRVRRGQLASIPCSYESIPRDTVRLTWSRRRNGISKDEEIDVFERDWIQLENGTLLIPNISDEDAGTYKCIVENWILLFATTAAITEVTVESGGPEGAGVALLYHSPDVAVVAGESETLMCIFENKTAVDSHSWTLADIRWAMEDRPLSSASGSQLVLGQLQYGDTGEYTCTGRYKTAAGAQQEIKGHISLVVEDIPRITSQSMTNQKVSLGDHVTFTCAAIGNPQPMITWFINARLLITNSGHLPDGDIIWNVTTGGHGNDGDSLALTRANMGGLIVSCNASNVRGYQLLNAYAEWTTPLPASTSDDVVQFPATDDVNGVSTTLTAPPTKSESSRQTPETVGRTVGRTVGVTTATRGSRATSRKEDLAEVQDTSPTTPNHVLMTSSMSTPTLALSGMPFYVIIIVSAIAAITAVLTTTILVVCYKRCRRKPPKIYQGTDHQEEQQQQHQQHQQQRRQQNHFDGRLVRTGSADSGIDDNPATEVDELKKHLKANGDNIIREERSTDGSSSDEEDEA